jgi:hypothetical protein
VPKVRAFENELQQSMCGSLRVFPIRSIFVKVNQSCIKALAKAMGCKMLYKGPLPCLFSLPSLFVHAID